MMMSVPAEDGAKEEIKGLYLGSAYLHTYIHTCILGRTYFVERSIHLIEEH